MLVTKLTAVFQAVEDETGSNPRDNQNLSCRRWNAYRNKIDTAEKARTLRAYTPQVCSAVGFTPTRR